MGAHKKISRIPLIVPTSRVTDPFDTRSWSLLCSFFEKWIDKCHALTSHLVGLRLLADRPNKARQFAGYSRAGFVLV